jgi:hypothetical protein
VHAAQERKTDCPVEPKSEAKGGASMEKAPSWGAERSRKQIMCRTGLGGPGSTERFAYGKDCKYASEGQAKAAAIKWVQAEKKKRGLE